MPRKHSHPKHTPFRLNTQCQSKRRFTSEAQVIVALKDQQLIAPHVELTYYACDLCGGWHLTSRPPSKK